MIRIQTCRTLNCTDWWDTEIRDVNTTWSFFPLLLFCFLERWGESSLLDIYWRCCLLPKSPRESFHQIPQLWNLTFPFIWNLRLMPPLSPPGILVRSRMALVTSRKKLFLNLHICCLHYSSQPRTRIHVYSWPADSWQSHWLVESAKQRNDPRTPIELTLQPRRSE